MLPLSDFSITFNNSNDFLRCILLVHIAAGSLLLLSALPPLLISLSLILLSISLLYTRKNAVPQPYCKQLTAHQKIWLLDYQDGRQMEANTVRVNFDGGFFLLLLLVSNHSKKRIIVFNDQLTPTQHRYLKVLSQIT